MNKNARKRCLNTSLVAASLLSSGWLVAVAASAEVPRFVDLPFIETGLYSAKFVTADFNGDGIPDVGSVDPNDKQVGITLGNGDGTFQPTQIYTVGAGPSDMKTTDLNGDGVPDLVVTLEGDEFWLRWVTVLLGTPDGRFTELGKFEAGAGPSALAVGDVNEDGKMDVVVSDQGAPLTQSVSVLLGNGDGTLQLPIAYDTGEFTRSVTLSDFNADGHLDIAVVNEGSNTFSILLGNGDGTFGAAVSYPTPETDPSYLAIADFNGDLLPDVAVAYLLPELTVSVFLQNRDGTFQSAIDVPIPFNYPRNVLAEDVNGDSIPDLVVPDGALTVLEGKGDGTFEAPVSYHQHVYATTLGQFDGTGGLDAVVYDDRGEFGFDFISGNLDGTFNAPPAFAAPINDVAAAAGDLNQDGKPDLVVLATPSTQDFTGLASVYLNTGGGLFAARADYLVGTDPTAIAIRDLNDDGLPDLVTANEHDASVSVLLGKGGGEFRNRKDYSTGPSPFSVAIADFDNDGREDLATGDGLYDDEVSLLIGAGDGSFPTHSEFPGPLGTTGIAAGDLDGDGNSDLAVIGLEAVRVFLGNGDGTFDTGTDYAIATNAGGGLIAIADTNGDTKPDLVAANTAVNALLNNGDGTFQTPVTSGGIAYLTSLQVGDVDGNGSVDLILGGLDIIYQNTLLLGNGDGSFSLPEDGHQFRIATALADFNSDGALDVADAESSLVSMVLNTGGSQVSLISSNNPSHVNEKVTFRARVDATMLSSGTPSGTVDFLDGNQTLATVSLVNGKASFTTSTLAAGTHRISASYSGDTVFVPRTSKPKKQVVQP